MIPLDPFGPVGPCGPGCPCSPEFMKTSHQNELLFIIDLIETIQCHQTH